MLRSTRRTVAKRQTDAKPILPPSLHTLGPLKFTPDDYAALQDWLAEGGWPPGAMEIHALEGYLVGLLVWPVELPSGAWLPPIWGERGWKVPAKLAGPEQLDKFVTMVSAFLQALDDRLYSFPEPYVPAIAAPVVKRRGERPDACSWAMGFIEALQQHTHAQGLKYRSEAVKAAAMAIARCASLPPAAGTTAELARAIYTFAAERSSRGPLEALDAPAVNSPSPRRIRR